MLICCLHVATVKYAYLKCLWTSSQALVIHWFLLWCSTKYNDWYVPITEYILVSNIFIFLWCCLCDTSLISSQSDQMTTIELIYFWYPQQFLLVSITLKYQQTFLSIARRRDRKNKRVLPYLQSDMQQQKRNFV